MLLHVESPHGLAPDARLASVGIANHPNIFGGLGRTWLHEQHDASAKVGAKVVRSLLDEGADVDEQ